MKKFLFWGQVTVEDRAQAEIAEHERALYDAETRLSKAEIDVAAHKKEIARLQFKVVNPGYLHVMPEPATKQISDDW